MRKLSNILFMVLLIFGTLGKMEAGTTEHIWISVSISARVHNVTKGLWYDTITNAVSEASNGNLIEVYPGTYNESVNIMGFTNLTIRAWSWTNSQNNTNTIIDATGFNSAFILNTSSLITIEGFSIKGATNGVIMTNSSVANTLVNNNIFSNEYGIKTVGSLAKNNYFISNNIYRNSVYGIHLKSSLSNFIRYNTLYSNRNGASGRCVFLDNADDTIIAHNTIYGNYDAVYLKNGATGNSINSNEIFNQDNYGIYIDNNIDNNNSIISNKFYSNNLRSINIRYADNIDIMNNRFFNNNGISIYLYGTATNINITHNTIYSNAAGGIIFDYQPSYNSIVSNQISDSSGTGVSITSGDHNDIIGNLIWGMGNYAIYLTGALGADYNNVVNNVVSNSFGGIEIGDHAANNFISRNRVVSNGTAINIGYDGSDYNTVKSNFVLNNSGDYGIRVGNADYAVVAYNIITNSGSSGILFENTVDGAQVYGNKIYNRDSGIYYNTTGNGNKIFLNTFKSNQNGVYIANTGVISNLTKNNFLDNTISAITNTTSQYVKITNNWFGSTIITNIRSKIHSNGGDTNFIPYRLFGEFDITEGADTEPLPRITWATAYIINSDDIVIKWTSTSGSDFVRYNVYRTTNSTGWSNLTYADVWTQINNISTTNITNYNLTPNTYYYYITAMDSAPYTNESWYSPEAVAIVVSPTNVHNVTQDKWYTNINSALAEANNGDVIEVHPGVYNEIVDLTGFSNLTLQAFAFTNSGDRTNTIIAGDNNNPVVTFDNTKKCKLIGFTIKYGNEAGILISDNTSASYSNYIANNIIYSNRRYGIHLLADNIDAVYGNIIVSNVIYSNYNGGGDRGGILLEDADNNRIENNRIYKFDEAGIVLLATASNNYIFKNTIYSNINYGISINNNNVLENTILSNYCYNNDIGIFIGAASEPQNITGNFTYKNLGHGILVQTPANRIYYNTSYSNTAGSGMRIDNAANNTNYGNITYGNLYGIYMDTADNTYVYSNTAYNNDIGIYGFESSDIVIEQNNVYNNVTDGIYLQATTGRTGNKILNNTVYSNNIYGIYLNGNNLDNNEILSNQIYNNISAGIYINLCDNNRIFNNSLISGSTNGIYIVNGSDNTVVSNNYIANNTNYGIYAGEGTGLKINLNTIASNYIGVEYADNVANPDIGWNNIYSNTKWNFALTVNQPVYITNVWWGTTIVSNIFAKVTNTGSSGNFDFIPYRLYGELSIEPGADVTTSETVTNITTFVYNNSNIVLNNWTKVVDGDFVRYRIYRSTNSSFSNLSAANIVTQIYDANITTWTDKGLSPGYYYYHITYCDNPAPPTGSVYTNESWYSVEGVASIYPHQLKLTMNSNITSYALYPGQTNKTVMAFNVMDWWLNQDIAKLKITNSGTMTTNEITAMKLWLDVGTITNNWDLSDTLVGVMSNIAGTGVWVISNFSPSIDIGNPGKNFIITVDISSNAIGYKTFRGAIWTNYVEDEAGKYSTNSITNSFYQYIPSRAVHNITQDTWYTNIQPAVSAANNNDVIEVYPGEFIENVDITNKDGITLRARSYILNGIKTNTIINGNNAGLTVRIRGGTAGMKLFGFTIKNGDVAGVQIDGAGTVNNKVYNNIIYSNTTYGIYVDNINNNTNYGNIIYDSTYGIYLDSQPNTIYSNTIYNCTNSGVYLLKVSSAVVDKNYVYNNKYGYYLTHTGVGSSSNNIIRNSEIYSNTYGIYLGPDSIDATTVISNNIRDNNNIGIYVNQSDSDVIKFNNILSSSTNIFIANGSDNEIVSNNYIASGSGYGIYSGDGIGLKIHLNTITSNNIGLYYGDNVAVSFDANNIFANTGWNFYNNTTASVSATNIWWGSTIYTNIEKGITNAGNLDVSWVPYRLYGEFNIQPNADTTYLPRITFATAYVINNDDIVIQWNQTSGGDFIRYNVYRTTNTTKWSNLTYNDVWTQINNISTTNITNYNMSVGTYYYYITAMDDAPYTNECWYSPEAVATVVPSVNNVWNITKDTYYNSIMSAVSNASNNNVLEILTPKVYNEKIVLAPSTTPATNLTIGSKSWWTNGDNTSTIISGGGTNDTVIVISNNYSLKLEGVVVSGATNYGIHKLGSGRCEFNYNIFTNNKYGILVQSGISNVIYSNQFYNNTGDGLFLAGCVDSVVAENKFYNNNGNGILISLGSYNSIKSNYLYKNGTGVYLINTTYSNKILNNIIYSNSAQGIVLNNAQSNVIYYNDIFGTNQNYGVLVYTNSVFNNLFYNKIYENKYFGISIYSNAHFNNITANTVYNQINYGIRINYDSTNNYIFNNVVYSNLQDISLGPGCKYNVITNNLIYGTNYGVYLSSAENNRIINNDIKFEFRGVQIISGKQNFVYNNDIVSNIIGISFYSGTSNEAKFNTLNSIDYYGVYLSKSTNDFVEYNTFYSNNSSAIIAFKSYQNYFNYNKIYKSETGITLYSNNYYNVISYNTNFNNYGTAIALVDLNDNNYLADNLLYDNNLSNNTNGGIVIIQSSFNTITNNLCYGKTHYFGIAVIKNSTNNRIINNSVYNSNYIGVSVNNGKDNYMAGNYVSGNGYGIIIKNSTDSTLKYNIVNNNLTNGISIKYSTNVLISYNYVLTNYSGIYVLSSELSAELNTIFTNDIGVSITNSTNNISLTKNNIYNNVLWNLKLYTTNLKITNNWWGSTIVSNIMSKISNVPFSNVEPYRLFGEFDITEGADTEPLPRITYATAYTINNDDIVIKWTKTTGADFVKYNVYRTTNTTGWSNLTYNDVWTQINNISTTNITNYNLTSGTYYYYITAMDDAPYTNECWYSPEAVAIVVSPTNVHNVTQDKWYFNITNAIAAANNGDVINVYPGVYYENVSISGFKNLTLQAYSWTNKGINTNTIIVANQIGWNPITIGSSTNVVINGFTINGRSIAGGTGVQIWNNSISNIILNNVIYSNGDAGIQIDNTSAYNHITNNQLFRQTGAGLRDGIDIGGSYNIVENNEIYFNDGMSHYGINLQFQSYSNIVQYNSIYSNGTGINVDGTHNTIFSNYITNNQNYGINIIGNTNYIQKNIIQNSGSAGIYFDIWSASKYNTIENNNISFNATNGIYGASIRDNYFYNNIIMSNNKGVYFTNIVNLIISNNNIYKNSEDGLYLCGASTNNIIINNLIYSNTLSGVKIVGNTSISNYIRKNSLFNNDTGIEVNNTSYNFMQNSNKIYNNLNGIEIVSSTNNYISGNYITNNTIFGVRLLSSSYSNTITNNFVVDNSRAGIYLNGANYNSILDNNLSYNSNGIEFDNTSGNQDNLISYNIILYNTNGIYYSSSANNNIILNSISSNRVGVNMNWIGGSIITLNKNNLNDNFYTNVINDTGNPQTILTNWFGTTVYTNIIKKVGGSQAVTFVPYRLFGEFDITPGADTTYLPRITFATAYVINNDDIVIQWNQTSGGDFIRYNVYRTTNSTKWSNLTYNDVWTQINNISTTNITNYNMSVGTYYYYITAMDDAPYTNECWYSPEAVASVVIDTTPPTKVASILPVSNFRTNGTTLNLEWTKSTDTLSGVTNYQLIISTNKFFSSTNTNVLIAGVNNTNITISNLKEGTNWWKVQAEDNAGNWSGFSNIWSFIVDLTPPNKVILVSPQDDIWTNVNNILFNWNPAPDNLTGITNYELVVTNLNTGWSTNIITENTSKGITLAEGTNKWFVRAYDKVFNIGEWSSTNRVKIDTTLPTGIVLVSPTNKFITNNNNIVLLWNKGTDNLSGITNYELFITNINTSWSTNNIYTITNTSITLSDGTNQWRVRSIDRAGNISVYSMTNNLVIDTVPPTRISLILPVSNGIITNKGGIEYKWTAGNDTLTGITNYRVMITNLNNGWKTNFTLATTNVILSNKGEGIYNWYVIDYDRAGNNAISITNPFTVDTNIPTKVSLVSLADGTTINSNKAELIWSKSTDLITGISNYELEISTNNFTSIWSNIITSGTNYTITGLNLWTNWWRVRARDKAGHFGEWSSTNRFIVEPIYGNLYISRLSTGKAWNNKILKSVAETNIELISLKISADTYDTASINLLRLSLSYSNGAVDSDFTNFVLYYDVGGIGNFNTGVDVSISTDSFPISGWVEFSNITGFNLNTGSVTNLLITFNHKPMTDTEKVHSIIIASNSVEFTVLGKTLTNDTIGSGDGGIKEVYEPGFFKILHTGSPWTGIVGAPVQMSVEVRRKIVTNDIVPWYSGVVTLDTTGAGNIIWTNISGAGAFSNITATTQGVYTFVSSDNGVVTLSLRDDTSESLYVELSSVTGITDDDSEGILKISYGTLAYFRVYHNTNQYTHTWGDVTIQAIATNGGMENILVDYTGNVTIDFSGAPGTNILWTNISGNGTFNTNNNRAEYTFVSADGGILNLAVKDLTEESININVRSGDKKDIDTEGYLHFISIYPYIVSMSAAKNSYVTVDEINPLIINFNELILPSSVTNSIRIYDSKNNILNTTFAFSTNVLSGGFKQTKLYVYPSISQNDILKQYLVEILTNIVSTNTNYYLIDTPNNSEFTYPYYSENTTIIDKDYGGTVVADDMVSKLIIDKDVLYEDAYVYFKTISADANDTVKEANNKAEQNQFIKVLDSASVYKEITAFNRSKNPVTQLRKTAMLKIKYNDTDNNGIVDDTSISEDRLKMYYLNEQTKEWEVIENSRVDVDNNYVIGDISHFSIYCIMADYQPKQFDASFITYPNPANPEEENVKIKFYADKSIRLTIKIYTVTGELVRDLIDDVVYEGGKLYDGDSAIIWDCKNDNGVTVVNGVYLIRVTGEYVDGSGSIEKIWKQGIVK